MDKGRFEQMFFYIPRGSAKSRFAALFEIDSLYRTGRLSFEDYLNFTGEALIQLFGQSEEFVEDWKEKARDIMQSSIEDLKKYIDSETLKSTNIQMDEKCACCPYMFEYKCRRSSCVLDDQQKGQ